MRLDGEGTGAAIARTNINLNLLLIAACEFLLTATLAIGNTLVGVVGKTLTNDVHLVTAPYAIMTLLAALTTIGASTLMRRVGRPPGFIVGAIAAILGGIITVWALWLHSFWTFCAAFGLIGIYKAFAQYYRFAAAEVVHENFALKSNAVAIVLVGSFCAAVCGPWIAARVWNLVPNLPYAGSFLAIALMGMATLALVSALKFPGALKQNLITGKGDRTSLSVLLRRPKIVVAISCATISYTVMAVMMVTAPLAIIARGGSVPGAALIMQFHVAGMYAPSFFTGKLMGRFGTRPTVLAGCLLQVLASVIAFSGVSSSAFATALLLCGIGWNFMYVGSTVMLTNSCSDEERATAQGANEFIMFSFVTVCSFAAATVLHRYGWHRLQILLAVALLVAAGVTLSFRARGDD
ncbi:MFS transporter [Paraburkholderia caribensis]|uniref:MFS transporter n=1 Tax=Paraburkholderia caribensis TaxID=75105 RepID=UPI0031CF111B